MSSAPDAHGPAAHDDHAFTGEPVRVLAPDEPRTPGWLPPLGVALFTAAAVVLLVNHGAEPAVEAKPDQAPPVVAAAPSVRPVTPPTLAAAPAATAGARVRPDQAQVRKVLDSLKAKGAPPTK